MNETNQQPEQSDEKELLTKIESHLKSIKSAVSFFVVMTVIAIILQGCQFLMI